MKGTCSGGRFPGTRHRPGVRVFAAPVPTAFDGSPKAKGASAEALAKLTADTETFKVQYANPMYRLPMTFAEIFTVGMLVSLVSAGLLRNSRFLPAPGLKRLWSSLSRVTRDAGFKQCGFICERPLSPPL